MAEKGSGWTKQSAPGADVSVKQGTNHPTQVNSYVSEKGDTHHVHVATDKKTGEVIGEWWRPNTKKGKK